MNAFTRKALLAASIGGIGGLPLLVGCEVHTGHGAVAVVPAQTDVYYGPDEAVVADAGYYYDAEYYDGGGHFHARHYWYYDGHRWDSRDAVPSGFNARERHAARDRHEVHDLHDQHR